MIRPLPLSTLFPYTTLFRSAAIALLVYLAYFILRGSVNNEEQRARLSAVYNIFAFVAMVPLIFIIRSEEHTSELQSRVDLVCRLLLEKKKIHNRNSTTRGFE